MNEMINLNCDQCRTSLLFLCFFNMKAQTLNSSLWFRLGLEKRTLIWTKSACMFIL